MAQSNRKSMAQLSGKHLMVDKANTIVVISAAIAAALVVFSLFASMSLIKKIGYQNDVINLRKAADEQLKTNLDSTEQLTNSFYAFDSAPESIIGTADNNSKIVLDALPSKYDFPALATSLDALVSGSGLKVTSITGTDDEVSAVQSSINPTPIAIPFEFSAEGNYESMQRLISDLQRSIRPFKIISIQFDAADSGLISVSVRGETAYQPAKEIGIVELKVDKNGKFVEGTTSDQAQVDQSGASQ